jgi:hypothetical protein
MIADFKVFHVGIQKALNIKTCSCDWIGKPITGLKKNNKKKTNKLSKKQKPNKQNKNKTTKNKEKNPHKFDDALKHLVSYGITFYSCCLF